MTDVRPDAKPRARVRDKALLRALHREWGECFLCHWTIGKLSLHHVHKHPRDDLRANLVMLCGDGTTGCHGLVEAHDPDTMHALGTALLDERPDTVVYLEEKLGGVEARREWMYSQYGV